ncbi:beta-1,3-glucanase family protein [Actinoplanes sp. NPDC051851]|uniref:beta-1,3-glucanase family protein n=1 Tax=Actinoplanes sp. NPDC051851 TaxID=3154753 RepID=UPI00343FB049
MRRRTAVLAAIVLALLGTLAAPAQAVGPALLPLTVSNNTGRSDAVYLYVLGTDLSTGKLGYVNAAGTFTAWSGGSVPPVAAPDVSIPGPAYGSSVSLKIPRGISGRVYFSLAKKLNFYLVTGGALVQPAPWSASDTNRDTLFDWSEFTYNDAGLWLNSSQVDMLGLIHKVQVTDGSGVTATTGTPVSGGRQNIIDGIKGLSNFASLVYTRSDGTVLRVLAPGKGLSSSTFFESYITSAWNAYTTKTLTVVPFADQPSVKYYGKTSGSVMTFTNTSGTTVASFTKPTPVDVWECAGNLAAPNDTVVGPIARTLCAAMNRTTLGTVDTQPSTDASTFYVTTPTNQYARLIHQNMVDGKAYAFAFDDVGGFESLVSSSNPASAAITLSPV